MFDSPALLAALFRTSCATAAACVTLAALSGLAGGEEPTTAGRPLESVLRLSQLPGEAIPPAATMRLPPADSAAAALQNSNGKRLTLAEVESMAVANHPALRVADGQTQAARGRWVQVGLRPNPVIGYAGDEMGNNGTAGQQGGFVSQEFVTAGKLGLSRAVASRDVAAAEQRQVRARLQVVATARSYYFETLSAQHAVALARQLGTMAGQAVKSSEQRLKAEEVSRAALLQSQIENESALLLEQQAENRYDAARRQLARAIGVDLDKEQLPPLEDSLEQPLPALDWESTRTRVLAESPELAEAQFAVEGARLAVERATAGRSPNVNVQAGVQHDNSTHDTFANLQLSLPLPVFDRNQGAITAACGELTAAQASLEQHQLALEQRLAVVLRDYLSARQRVNKYESTILPATRQSLNMVSQAYGQGELDYLQLLSAQRTFTEKHLAYLQDLDTAWQKWVQIDSLLVGHLSENAN